MAGGSFQSPTSRGDLCHFSPSIMVKLSVSFNPLLRGATFATRRPAAAGQSDPRFQSPTSRGDLCHRQTRRPPGWVLYRFQSPTSRGDLCHSPTICDNCGRRIPFQSPTSRGDLCHRHSELGHPSLASPPEAVVVVSSSAPNSEGGGQPPPSEASFGVDHPTGAIHSWNLMALRQTRPSASHTKALNITTRC